VKISVNSESVEISDIENIAQLIESYNLQPQSILVEYNGVALHRREWPQQMLSPGDRVEFIRVVAGG
jgi:thiamine biosynthesis protein ThiS